MQVAPPLVTFAIIAYRQEAYIREAVEGALSQTYAPLEIILSDDDSPDGTYAVMEEMVRDYSGPHTLRLRRNEKNLGLIGHLNAVLEEASGEWIVLAAGDDISSPDRCEVIAEVAKSGSGIFSMLSFCEVIGTGPAGTESAPRISEEWIGSTEAVHREVFRKFGPLLTTTYSEDWAFLFRAQLLGGTVLIEKPLVKWRRHDASLTTGFHGADVLKQMKIHLSNVTQFEEDLAKGGLATSEVGTIREGLALRRETLEAMVSRKTPPGLLAALFRDPSVSLRAKVSILVVLAAPFLLGLFRRVEMSRFSLLSPTRHAFGFVNPKSLLRNVRHVRPV
jgi:hypothetical protein